VFERYAPALDTHRDDVLAQTMHDDALAHPPLSVYRHEPDKLDAAYEEWKRARQDKAKRAFDEMLRESAFVEFWGRMKKVSAETRRDQKQGAKKEEEEEEEEEEEVMLVDMARTVDLDQIQAVLGRDARFRAFRHVPEQREAWIRQHLHSLAAPSKSVHR
jgi:transcription elongation regulator 1